jgi:formate/nitrite transporter FocA (FNT family)
MAFKTPQGITEAGIATGVTKANLSPPKMLVGSFLAGAYIAFAGIVAVAVSSGLDPKTWGTLPTFFTGIAFVLGLVLVVVAGSELLTGNMALVPLALFKGRISVGKLLANWGIVTIGNLIGSLFVAYFWRSSPAS